LVVELLRAHDHILNSSAAGTTVMTQANGKWADYSWIKFLEEHKDDSIV